MAQDTTVADRQRDRAARGIGTGGSARFGTDRPAPPRRRRPTLAALAVLLVVGGAALAGLLALRLDSREPVLVLAQDVPAGTEITTDVLATTDVAADGLQLVPSDQAGQVLGTYTTVPLSQGQLLETSSLTTAEPFGTDKTQVGVPLSGGMAPDGLRSGDLVRLVRVGDGNTPPAPIATALVLSTSTDTSGGTLGGGGESSTSATVLVPTTAADAAVDAAANDRLGVALAQRGVSVADARLVNLGTSR
jgi:hypothetical protein